MFENSTLGQMLRRISDIDATKVFIEVSDGEVKKIIADMNRQQLLSGINSEGNLLSDIGGGYSEFTLDLHPEKDEFTVTLFDEGDYHESITAEARTGGYFITSNPIKEDFGRVTNLYDRWGKEVEGLTKENIAKLISETLIKKYIEYLKKNIFQV